LIYGIAAINQAFALSSLFNDSKMAGEIGTFLTTLTTLVSYLIFTDRFSSHKYLFIIVCIFPQPAVAFSYMIASA
jgi:ATP-binding cassette, subfamily A (ABC1), member 3